MMRISLILAMGAAALGDEPRKWTTAEGRTVEGTYVSLIDEQVSVKTPDGETESLAFDKLGPDFQARVLQLEDTPTPGASPEWAPGFRVRYPVRVVGNLLEREAQTVMVRIPTGGWLKEDTSDLVVRTVSGRNVAAVVLSHDALGDTIVQFRRSGHDRWYWVYAVNPEAPPRDLHLQTKLAEAKKSAEQALLAKMAAQKISAKASSELRDITALVNRETTTAQNASQELAEWNNLLPERLTVAKEAAAKIPPAQEAASKAAAAHENPEQLANETTALERKLAREAAAARKLATAAATAHNAIVKQLAAAQQAVKAAAAAHKAAVDAVPAARQAAQQAATAQQTATQVAAAARKAADGAAQQAKTKATPDNHAKAAAAEKLAATKSQLAQAAETKKLATEKLAAAKAQAATVAADKLAAAQKPVAELPKAVQAAQTKRGAAEKVAAAKEVPAKAAAVTASAARLAAAPTATAKAAADRELTQLTGASKAAEQAVAEAQQRIAAATELKTNAEQALAGLEPKLEPVQAAATATATAADKAVVNATTKSETYKQLALDTDPRVFKEGLTAEYREWAGDKLTSWAEVVAGLQKSDNVLGGAIVGEVFQNVNPFRRSDLRNFAASYRGYLKVDTPGVYSFLVNGDDTAFLFINGYKVYSRTGSNALLGGKVSLYSVGADIQLEAGVHPFEVHHIVGNTPGAIGVCSLLWLKPGAKQWEFVSRDVLTQSLLAVPVGVEAFDNGQVAVSQFGMDDTLTSDGVTLYLSQLRAVGHMTDPAKLVWNFGDGTTATGPSTGHIFFDEGDYEIALKSHLQLPPFRRRCHVWTPPVPTSPHSLAKAVRILGSTQLDKLGLARLADVYHFLQICEQPTRWPVMERLCRHLLAQKDLDVRYRAHLYTSLMEAAAEQGRGTESLRIVDQALDEVGQFRTLGALILLEAARVNRDYLKDFSEADRLYARIITENRRLRHPLIRQAAVAWGDMFARAGDSARAAEAYRMARTLGTVGAGGESQGDPVKRGALLRVAEQQLKEGNVRNTTRLLARIEADFPEQKLEGLYRFLRGEARRQAGDYEPAIRDYEALLELRQWASYRANALSGIADSYYRMGEFEKALVWLSDLKESFPAFYAERQLDPYRSGIEARLLRSKGDLSAGADDTPRVFAQLETRFEPDESQPFPNLEDLLSIVPSMGIDGPYTGMLDARPGWAKNLPTLELKNLPSQGTLWVELWYRDELANTGNRSVIVDVASDAGASIGRGTVYTERSFGQWQKIALALPAPQTVDGKITIGIQDLGGLSEIDGLRIRHTSDWQNSALRNFIEGADPQ